jgi:hypothetical protein
VVSIYSSLLNEMQPMLDKKCKLPINHFISFIVLLVDVNEVPADLDDIFLQHLADMQKLRNDSSVNPGRIEVIESIMCVSLSILAEKLSKDGLAIPKCLSEYASDLSKILILGHDDRAKHPKYCEVFAEINRILRIENYSFQDVNLPWCLVCRDISMCLIVDHCEWLALPFFDKDVFDEWLKELQDVSGDRFKIFSRLNRSFSLLLGSDLIKKNYLGVITGLYSNTMPEFNRCYVNSFLSDNDRVCQFFISNFMDILWFSRHFMSFSIADDVPVAPRCGR